MMWPARTSDGGVRLGWTRDSAGRTEQRPVVRWRLESRPIPVRRRVIDIDGPKAGNGGLWAPGPMGPELVLGVGTGASLL